MRDLTNENLAYVMQPFCGMFITLPTIRLMDARLEDNFGPQYRALVDRNGHVWIVDTETKRVIARPDL